MYQPLGPVTLKTGERVEAGVVHCPDPAWADRVNDLLGHKWEPWLWQNDEVLRRDLGIEVYYYLLHRDGRPFSNILTAELEGVGLFGHVFTRPEDRRKHATSELMRLQMADFRRRGGRALFLGTGYDSPAYHIYAAHGFRGVEPRSGVMEFYADDRAGFEAAYFADGPTTIEPIGWRHWPASSPLFVRAWPGGGVVRAAGPRLLGRSLSEEPFVALLRREARHAAGGEPAAPQAYVLRHTKTSAVLGLACWQWDSTWPGVCVADVYAHPARWGEADGLFASLALPPEADRVVAYADAGCPEKVRFMERYGFRKTATLPGHVASDATRETFVDVDQYTRT